MRKLHMISVTYDESFSMVPVLLLVLAQMSSIINVDLVKVNTLYEALVRVAVHAKIQLVLAFLRQRELKSDRECLCHGHALHRKSIPTIGPDGNHPVYRLLHRMLKSDICLALLRTRRGLVKSDLECDTLAGPQSISLEELSGDGECRVRAQESLHIPSGAESDLPSSHIAR
jgi:hypothetical protein